MRTDHFLLPADVMTDARVVVCLAPACVSHLAVDVPLVSSSSAFLPRPHFVPGPDVSQKRTAAMLRQP
jgi:hypothetical protein